MFKTRAALLGVLALFIVSGIATSTASAAGPFWHVAGTKLGQNQLKQVKFQSKGNTVLTGKAFGVIPVVIECKNSVSEGASIENNPSTQGQGKGRITFTQCETVTPTEEACRIIDPITTNQIKAYQAFNGTKPENKQQKFVTVFEPQQGTTFAVLHFLKTCGGLFKEAPVAGGVVGEFLPIEKENQENLVSFPKEAITTIVHLQQERKIGLTFSGEPAVFAGDYGVRLQTNELWGDFAQ